MYLIPKSEVTIGGVKFYGENSGINQIEIDRSVLSLSNSAKITIPRNYVKREGKGILDCIHTGDRVTIRIGYGEELREEFKGFVSKIGDGTPIVIEVDDDWYPFKKSDPIEKSWKTTTLREVLQYLFKGFAIDIMGDKTNVNLCGGFIIARATAFEAIKGLKESYGFTTGIDFDNKKITCFYPFDFDGFDTHTYVFGTRDEKALQALYNRGVTPNVAKNNLKFERKEDLKLQVTAIAKQKTGKDLKVTIGSQDKNATKRTLTFGCEINNEKDLKAAAEQELAKRSFDGYSGNITGFGVPPVTSGDSLRIVDPDNSEREATYLVEAVKTTYKLSEGIRRVCTLSYKIN